MLHFIPGIAAFFAGLKIADILTPDSETYNFDNVLDYQLSQKFAYDIEKIIDKYQISVSDLEILVECFCHIKEACFTVDSSNYEFEIVDNKLNIKKVF